MHRFILSENLQPEQRKPEGKPEIGLMSSLAADNGWLDRVLEDDSGLDDSVISSLAELRFA